MIIKGKSSVSKTMGSVKDVGTSVKKIKAKGKIVPVHNVEERK